MRAGAVVLAAGASRRLGVAKQTVVLGGERLVERAVRVAGEAGLWPVVVVLGCGAEEIRAGCELGEARVVVNEGWGEGMGSSLRVGVGELVGWVWGEGNGNGKRRFPSGMAIKDGDGDGNCDGNGNGNDRSRFPSGMTTKEGDTRVMLGGVVVMTCDQPGVTGGHLRELVRVGVERGVAVGSGYGGKCGVPAYFPGTLLGELLLLEGDMGARCLLMSAPVVPLEYGELDVDTPEALAHARKVFG